MNTWVQYRSLRLGDEFVDMLSYQRGWRGKCAQCGAPFALIYSITFGAEFCRPGCHIKFNREYIKHMEETYNGRSR